MREFPVGHDLWYLMNSGDNWVENVEAFMNDNNISVGYENDILSVKSKVD
jgi:hypothetical protein